MDLYKYLVFIFFYVNLLTATAIPTNGFLQIFVGEKHILKSNGAIRAKVSRKGVVDLTLLPEKTWAIVGMQRGLVGIEFFNEQGDKQDKIFVQIEKKHEDQKQSQLIN